MSMDPKSTRVGWIGVGKMGLPMASHLLKAGCRVIACEPNRSQLDMLASRGALRAATPAEAAREADVSFSSIPNDEALREVALAPNGVLAGARPGSIYVDTSTVSPAVSAEVAALARQRGVHYLRVSVSGNNHFAEQASLTIMASGERSIWEELRPLLGLLGDKHFYVGEGEQARTLKLVINLMIAGTAGILAEALALGRKGGLDWREMLDIVSASAVGAPIVKSKAVELKRRDFTPTFTCVQMAKDLDLILDAGREWDVPMFMTAQVRQMMQALAGLGLADEDYIATVKLIEQMSGLPTDRV